MSTLGLMQDWVKPAGVALVVAAILSVLAWKTTFEAMGAQVATNTASIAIISDSLAAQATDKIAELEGRLAVLRHIANNGGLSEGQRLEKDWLEKRLKALK